MCKAMKEVRNDAFETAAKTMLKAGKYALEEIAEMTNLSLEKVRKLRAEMNAS